MRCDHASPVTQMRRGPSPRVVEGDRVEPAPALETTPPPCSAWVPSPSPDGEELMATLPADTRRFRAAREAEWRRLEHIVATAERRSVKALSDEDLLALPVLYRGALSSLSVARETSLDLELVTYLEGLCARAYFFVYGVRTTAGKRLAAFFARDWPAAVQSLWKETLVSLALTFVGALTGYLLVMADPSWYDNLIPAGLAQGRDFSASPETLRE